MTERVNPMKDLLKTMFEGWAIYQNSWTETDEGYREEMSMEQALTQACGGDVLKGNLLALFGHWSNDIASIGAHYGVGIAKQKLDGTLIYEDGTVDTLLRRGKMVVVEVPPAPTSDCYWFAGEWKVPDPERFIVKEGPAQ